MANETTSEDLSLLLNSTQNSTQPSRPLFDPDGIPTANFWLLFSFIILCLATPILTHVFDRIYDYLKDRFFPSTPEQLPPGWTEADRYHCIDVRVGVEEPCYVIAKRGGIKIDCIVCFPPDGDNKV